VVLCAGISLLDGVDSGRVGRRQLGLFLLALGGIVGAWALVVTALLALLGLPADPAALWLLAGAILAAGGAVYLLRHAPERRREPAIVADRSAVRATHRRREAVASGRRLDRLAG
jgi:O-antigen ligase